MTFKLLQPGDKIAQSFLDRLKTLNEQRAKCFPQYISKVRQLVYAEKGDQPLRLTENHKIFLGGFVLGEGSLNVSAKKGKLTPYGLYLDPEFSVTQHFNRLTDLTNYLELFQSGRISYKSGSNATLVFRIGDRTTLLKKVVPYWKKYVLPYCESQATKTQFKHFAQLLWAFHDHKHLQEKAFLDEMLPLWDKLRQQKGQKNESFGTLAQAKQYVKQYVINNKIE